VFLTERNVPATNNDAERALRPSVIFRKVTYGFRSSWSADVYAAIRSVISTARLNGGTAFQAIAATLNRQPLFPAA
jgi:transposase